MTPQEIVHFAEDVHASRNIDCMMECFDPDEIWTIRNNRLIEWHAYCSEYPRDGKKS